MAENESFFQIQISLADWLYRQNIRTTLLVFSAVMLSVAFVFLLFKNQKYTLVFFMSSLILMLCSHVAVTGRQWLFEFGSAPWPVYMSALLTSVFIVIAMGLLRKRAPANLT
jgi:hypothetical protein